MLHALASAPVLIDAWGVSVAVVDAQIVPTVLLSVLMLYRVQGTAVAQITILGIVGVSLLVLAVQVLNQVHLGLPGGFNRLGLPVKI